jgi:DNA invertase Pin-like site-specific DNA recombinase
MDCIYARQSIDKKDSISIESQIDLCRRECRGTPAIYQDKGYSGKNTDRPDFKRLMQAVENGEVDRIIVYRLDRISRSLSDFGRIWDTLKEHNAEFVSINEKFDTSTPMGRAMVYIIMVFAQLERETIPIVQY